MKCTPALLVSAGAVAGLTALPTQSDAAVLAEYVFNESNPAQWTSDDTDTNTVASLFTPGSWTNATVNQGEVHGIPNALSVATPSGYDYPNSVSDAVEAGSYFSFDVEAEPGVTFTPTQLDFTARTTNNNRFNSFTSRYSTDDGATWTDIQSTTASSVTHTVSEPLSIGSVDSILVQILWWNTVDGGPSAGVIATTADVTLYGESVIPEPAALSLVGMGGLLVLRRLRS